MVFVQLIQKNGVELQLSSKSIFGRLLILVNYSRLEVIFIACSNKKSMKKVTELDKNE